MSWSADIVMYEIRNEIYMWRYDNLVFAVTSSFKTVVFYINNNSE